MVGERIQQYRKEKGLSLSELADAAGVSKSYLSSIERGVKSNPSIQFLEKISIVLSIPMDSLLYDIPEDEGQIEQEWVELIQLAKGAGVTTEQFREFVEFNQWRVNRVSSSSRGVPSQMMTEFVNA